MSSADVSSPAVATPPPRYRLRPPAYARELIEARRQGMVPYPWGAGQVALAMDWSERYVSRIPRLVCPADVPVQAFDFACLAGLGVYLPYGERFADRAMQAVGMLLRVPVVWVWAVHWSRLDACRAAFDRGDKAEGSRLFDLACREFRPGDL